LIVPQRLSAELTNERMVRAAPCLAFGHEITILQQLRSVFLQEPLDRTRARLMRANVDIADTFCHPGTIFRRTGHRQFSRQDPAWGAIVSLAVFGSLFCLCAFFFAEYNR
jgi:hypothetical protein